MVNPGEVDNAYVTGTSYRKGGREAFGEHLVDLSYKYKYIYMSSVIRRGSGY